MRGFDSFRLLTENEAIGIVALILLLVALVPEIISRGWLL